MDAIRVAAFFAIGLLASPLLGEEVVQGLGAGLLCDYPFNGSAVPALATGSPGTPSPTSHFVAVQDRQALDISAQDDAFKIPAQGNFDRRKGTVAFWINPGWKAIERSSPNNLLFADDNFQINYDGGKRLLFFMTGKTVPEDGYHWDYGVASTSPRKWNVGEWHHVAITWDASSGEKTLYLDGQVAVKGQTPYIRTDSSRGDNPYVRLGGGAGPISYGELAIWNRVLGADEIARLGASPAKCREEIQSALSRLPPRVVPATVPLEWTLVPESDPARLVVVPGQEIAASLPVVNQSSIPFSQTVRLILFDFWEKTVAVQDVPLDLKPGEGKSIDVRFTPPNKGVFKIGVDYEVEGKHFFRDVFSFAAWSEPKAATDDDSFFGSHIESFTEEPVRLAARLGETWNRGHDMLQATWWPRVQPEPGAWNHVAENTLDFNRKYHLNVLGEFFGTPYWAAPSGTTLKPQTDVTAYPYGTPPDLALFRQYVLHVVGAYKDYIHVWNIWNEPEVSLFWKGTPEQFAELSKVAYEAAKEADSHCTVLLGDFTAPPWKWHEMAAKAGAFKYGDAIALHHYVPTNQSPEENEVELKALLRHFQELAVQYGPGKEMPIWNTEGGIGNTTWLRGLDYGFLPPPDQRDPLNWRLAAIRLLQDEVIEQANGIVKHFYYFQHTVSTRSPQLYGNLSLMEMTRAPKPLWIARVNLADQVSGCLYRKEIKRTEGRLWINLYEKRAGGGVVAVCWAGDHGAVRIESPAAEMKFQRIDIMGNEVPSPAEGTITDEPCYLRFSDSLDKVKGYFETAAVQVVREPEPLSKPPDEEAGADVPPLPDYVAIKEEPGRDFAVDLKPWANMGLADDVPGDGRGGWTDQGSLNDAHELPVGKETYYQVPIDMADPAANAGKSILVLRGQALTPAFPSRINGVAVGNGQENIRALYFLQSTAWVEKPGTIGKYVVHYRSGKTVDVPIVAGINVADWWQGYQKSEESRPIPFLTRQNQTAKPQWRYLRLWEWQNPTPEDPISSFDFVSNETSATPILVAVTALRVP